LFSFQRVREAWNASVKGADTYGAAQPRGGSRAATEETERGGKRGHGERKQVHSSSHIFFIHRKRSPFRNLFNYKTTL
jgi:hypothetical protein